MLVANSNRSATRHLFKRDTDLDVAARNDERPDAQSRAVSGAR